MNLKRFYMMVWIGVFYVTIPAWGAPPAKAPSRRPAQAAKGSSAVTPAPAAKPTRSASAVPTRVGRGLIVRVKTKDKLIQALTFASPHVQIRFLANHASGEPIAILQGKFTQPGWNLVFDTHAVFSPKPGKESFRIGIPVSDDITAVKVTAVGPRGQTQIEKFFIQFDGGREAFLAFLTGKQLEGNDEGARPADWSLLVRVAPSMTLYTGRDGDNRSGSASGEPFSGSSLTFGTSAELRWRGPKAEFQKWTWSGSLNLEILTQKVLGETKNLPRGYVRGFYGSETGKFRYGGLAQVQGGSAGIFVPVAETEARRAMVTRIGGGVGGFAVFRPAPTLGVSLLGLVRMDMGGQSDQLNVDGVVAKVKPGIGWEAGFGLVLGVSSKLYLEGRARALSESYSWQSSVSPAVTSTFGNTFLILDIGLGYKF